MRVGRHHDERIAGLFHDIPLHAMQTAPSVASTVTGRRSADLGGPDGFEAQGRGRRARDAALALAVTALAPLGVASAATSGAGIGTSAALERAQLRSGDEAREDRVRVPPAVRRAVQEGREQRRRRPCQGVTKDTIKVVVYTGIPADQTPEDAAAQGLGQLATNLSTGLPGTIENAMHDTTAAVGHPLETWGRTIEYEYIARTGADETAQRADAVSATAKKPFAVLDLASAEVFCSEVAARKVIAICATGTNESMDAQKPYRYSTFIDYWANVIGTAELIGKGLKGKPAQWAGDPAMKTQTRKFGSVFQTGQTGIDEDLWKSSLAKYKAPKFAAELGYDAGTGDPLGNSAVAQEQAPVMIGKLKDAGVTSVVLFTDISMTVSAADGSEHAGVPPRVGGDRLPVPGHRRHRAAVQQGAVGACVRARHAQRPGEGTRRRRPGARVVLGP